MKNLTVMEDWAKDSSPTTDVPYGSRIECWVGRGGTTPRLKKGMYLGEDRIQVDGSKQKSTYFHKRFGVKIVESEAIPFMLGDKIFSSEDIK